MSTVPPDIARRRPSHFAWNSVARTKLSQGGQDVPLRLNVDGVVDVARTATPPSIADEIVLRWVGTLRNDAVPSVHVYTERSNR